MGWVGAELLAQLLISMRMLQSGEGELGHATVASRRCVADQ